MVFRCVTGKLIQAEFGHHVQREHIKKAAEAGIEFVNISPIASDVDSDIKCQWMPIRPGTDVAFIIGLAHTIHHQGLSDSEFLDKYTLGFEHFFTLHKWTK